jgi:hypothetical protein
MDDERVLARLDRVAALDRGGAAPGEVLAELRALVREVEDEAVTPPSSGLVTGGKGVTGASAGRVHGT